MDWPAVQHIAAKLIGLAPQPVVHMRAACFPACGEFAEIGQGHVQPGVIEDGERSRLRPKGQRCPPVCPFERGALVPGRFVEMHLVGLHIVEAAGGADFAFVEWNILERCGHAVRPQPVGKRGAPVANFDGLELFLIV